MRTTTDPALLSPDQRLAEIASLLARGLRALRDRDAISAEPACTSGDNSAPNCLDVSPDKSVTVTPVNSSARKEM